MVKIMPLIVLLVTFGCVSPTAYQPADWTGGYSETPLSPTKYKVSSRAMVSLRADSCEMLSYIDQQNLPKPKVTFISRFWTSIVAQLQERLMEESG